MPTTLVEPLPMARRFDPAKLTKVLERLGKRPTWLANEVGVTEATVRNWLGGKKPDLDSYLSLVDALARAGVRESEILEIKR